MHTVHVFLVLEFSAARDQLEIRCFSESYLSVFVKSTLISTTTTTYHLPISKYQSSIFNANGSLPIEVGLP
jgi:hypothetical protein